MPFVKICYMMMALTINIAVKKHQSACLLAGHAAPQHRPHVYAGRVAALYVLVIAV